MVQTSIASWFIKKTSAPREPLNEQAESQHQSVELPSVEPRARESSTSAPRENSSNINTNGSAACPQDCTLSKPAPRLPSNVSIEPITASNIKSFRRLTALLLPMPYPDGFYAETLDDAVISSLSRVAIWHETPIRTNSNSKPDSAPKVEPQSLATPSGHLVAAIRCRLLQHPPGQPTQKTPVLYISTITTLAPFRQHALGTQLLQCVAATAVREYGTTAVMAHVWEANEEGMEWYRKRGFKIVERLDGYYRRLAPQTTAFLVKKDISAVEMLQWSRGVS